MAILLSIKDDFFRARAYDFAANSLQSLDQDVAGIYKKGGVKALEDIPGIGKGIAAHIEEFIKTGSITDYQKLKDKYPVDAIGLTQIEGIGPKTIGKLYVTRGIRNVNDLNRAVLEGKLAEVEGLGEKSIEKIKKSIAFIGRSQGRFLLGAILPTAREMLKRIRALDFVERAEYAGSVRRMQETVGDLDFLVISRHPARVMDEFVKMPEVEEVVAHGDTKTTVRLANGMQADVRVLAPESFGAGLQYFTGDKHHNIILREFAIKKGFKLNEYGLWKNEINLPAGRQVAGKTEEEIYEALGMQWMEPELRTNHGEIEASLKNELPHLIGYEDLKGDLQVQTDWTDGEHSILEMACAAKKAHLEYIAITDHTKSLAMTGGADEAKLEKQMHEIDRVQKEIPEVKILKGAEVNINKDGTMDISDKTLAQLDVVGAAVHSHFDMSEKDMTMRLIRAIENPHVDILFHPTGRIMNKREAYQMDMAKVVATAVKTKTILEIDAQPARLDLHDDHIREAAAAGSRFAVDSDAHSAEQFAFLKYGIAQARRGWLSKKDVINTLSWQEMLKMLK